MILNTFGYHPLSNKITLFMGSILLFKIISAHKCFVCGPNTNNKGDFIPSCERFNPNDPIFIKECVADSKGCSIQTNGTILTRTCEPFAILDCKKANNVEYCYCSKDLCNDFHLSREDEEDNEPDAEGSGSDVTRVLQVPGSTTLPNSIPPISSTSQLTTHQFNTLLIFSILLFVRSSCKC